MPARQGSSKTTLHLPRCCGAGSMRRWLEEVRDGEAVEREEPVLARRGEEETPHGLGDRLVAAAGGHRDLRGAGQGSLRDRLRGAADRVLSAQGGGRRTRATVPEFAFRWTLRVAFRCSKARSSCPR